MAKDSGDMGSSAALVKSLRKAFAILETVADSSRTLSIAEIATAVGIPRATSHRLVQSLLSMGYLSPTEIDGRLGIGLKVLPLAASVLNNNRLRIESLPHLQSLAQQTGERVNLGIVWESKVLYLAGIEKPSLPTIYSQFGKTAPLYCSSLGKSMLASMPEAEAEQILSKITLQPQTSATITSPVALRKDLAETRARGYAVDRQEHIPGIFCVSTTIFDTSNRPVGAIGLSGRALEPLLTHVKRLKDAAELISHMLC